MTTIYHNPMPEEPIPDHWVKQEGFVACYVNEHNLPWNEGVDRGPKYQFITKYEQHYGFFARVGRIVYAVLLSLTGVILAFKAGRELVGDLLFNSVSNIHIIRENGDISTRELADVHVSMAGNPAHMGHMHMAALAVNRLVEEGYQINAVKIFLAEEQYLGNKVEYCNMSIKRHNDDPEEKPEMLRALIPRAKRIAFLRAAIEQAKKEEVFDEDLAVDYADSHAQNRIKIFYVCGTDFAEDPVSQEERYNHLVIVMRDEKMPEGIVESHTEAYSRLIVRNSNQTSQYSSSKIQNGAYEQLPESIREDFKRLHQEAQSL